jgi:hypothetical protein
LRCWDARTWELAACAHVGDRPFRPDRDHRGSGAGDDGGGSGGEGGDSEASSSSGSSSDGGGGGASLQWVGPRRLCCGALLGGSVAVLDVVAAEAVADARDLARDAVRDHCYALKRERKRGGGGTF